MNAFADWLFSLLLGWTGHTANRLWNSLSKGENSFASLLSKIWLPLLIIIVALCTVADLIVRFRHSGIRRLRTELEHKEMREAMEHGEMAKEYRDEMASFVSEENSPYIADGLFNNQDEYAGPYVQSPDLIEYHDEPQFFEPQQDIYTEYQAYNEQGNMLNSNEYAENNASFNESHYQYGDEQYNQYQDSRYQDNTYEENELNYRPPYERVRRSDRWKKRKPLFAKRNETEEYTGPENQSYDYEKYSDSGREQDD